MARSASPTLLLDRLVFHRCQYRLRRAGWVYPRAYHRKLWEMYICWEGRLQIGLKRAWHTLERRQALLIAPGAAHEARTAAEQDCFVILIQFSWPWRRLTQAAGTGLTLAPRALALLRDFMDARAADAVSTARRRALLGLFLLELVEPARADEPVRPPPFAPYARDDLVRRVIDHLQAHLVEGLDLATLCAVTGYSEGRLRHLFRERAGVSISEVMLRLRLDEARRLLHFSDLKISAIAAMVGFAQTPRFNHFFRQRMGCTPTQYVASGVAFGAKWGSDITEDEVFLAGSKAAHPAAPPGFR